jgi:MFS family permease
MILGPIIGGLLAQRWGWRSTQWLLVIYGGILFGLLLFLIPETLKRPLSEEAAEMSSKETAASQPDLSRVSTRRSISHASKRGANFLKTALINPLHSLTYLRFPAVLITVYWASITFGSLYMLNISIESTFSADPYHFSTTLVGLCYIPNSLGYVFGSVIGGRWSDYIMAREARSAGRIDERGKPILIPEDRMRENAWLAAVMYPLALVWYGWGARYGVVWIVPLLANFFYGFGSMIVFANATTMLTEFLPGKSSTGVAINNFVRNIFAAVGGAVAGPLITAVGNGFLFTGLGVITLASGSIIWAMRRFGPHWRITMEKQLKAQSN